MQPGPRVTDTILLLGVDGGGTRCRARLATPAGHVLGEGTGGAANIPFGAEEGVGAAAPAGHVLGEGTGGPANIRFGLEESFGAIVAAAEECLQAAGLPASALGRTVAGLALAGASEPAHLAEIGRAH